MIPPCRDQQASEKRRKRGCNASCWSRRLSIARCGKVYATLAWSALANINSHAAVDSWRVRPRDRCARRKFLTRENSALERLRLSVQYATGKGVSSHESPYRHFRVRARGFSEMEGCGLPAIERWQCPQRQLASDLSERKLDDSLHFGWARPHLEIKHTPHACQYHVARGARITAERKA